MKGILTLFLLILAPGCSCLNVLVWSATIGQSHVNFLGNIADTLVHDGHNVTMIMIENDPDVTSTGTHNVEHIMRFSSPLVDRNEWSLHNFKKGNVFMTQTFELGDYFSMQSINYRICQSLLSDERLISTLNSSKFDLAVVEMFNFCPAGIFHMAGIPKIMMSSALGMTLAHYELFGLPVSLSYTPTFLTHMGSRMGFVERVYNVIFHYSSKLLYLRMYYSEQALFEAAFPGFPDLAQLYKSKTDFLLLNSNEFTESTRPSLVNIHYIGGATTGTPKELSQDFESILSKGKRGVILFSLGSLVKSSEMPIHIRRAFQDAFRSLPEYEFIWKDDVESNFTQPNVHYRKWVPQVDLLADPRIKLFITHGGMNSIQESLQFGVPMVCMPIFADQDANAALAAERGFSVNLDKFTVTKDDVLLSIRKVLSPPGGLFESSYSSQARMASRVLRGSPLFMRKEIQRLAVLSATEPNLSHLRLEVDRLNPLEYYNIDVHVFISVLFGSIAFTIFKLLNTHIRIHLMPQKQKLL